MKLQFTECLNEHKTINTLLKEQYNKHLLCEGLSEDYDAMMPFVAVPLADIESECRRVAKEHRPFINIGYMKEVAVSAKVKPNKNGELKINKETGEPYPCIKIYKCSEAQYQTLFNYANLKQVKDRDEDDIARVDAWRQKFIDAGEEIPGIGDWIVPNILGVHSRTLKPRLVVADQTKNRPNVCYYISVDFGPFERFDKIPDEYAQYELKTPDYQGAVNNAGDINRYRNFVTAQVYVINDLGDKLMMRGRNNIYQKQRDEIAAAANAQKDEIEKSKQ